MASNVTGMGTTFNLPNYAGQLYTASPTKTPFLSMIGGLTGGMQTENDEFPTGVLYEFPEAAQPEISETASTTAPTGGELVKSQQSNVTQIFHEAIEITYARLANRGKLSGLNTAGAQPEQPNEEDFQIARKLEKIARDVEFTFLNGKYQKASSAGQANKTRGMIELCSTGTTIAAANAPLSLDLLGQLYRKMANAGAIFGNMVLLANAEQKQRLTSLYEKQLGYNSPAQRNVGGMSITQIENDFFQMGVAYDPFMPVDTILIVDLAACAPVFQAVPGKGVLFLEELAKTGAANRKQIYGEIGLAHGPSFLHGTLTGLDYEGRE